MRLSLQRIKRRAATMKLMMKSWTVSYAMWAMVTVLVPILGRTELRAAPMDFPPTAAEERLVEWTIESRKNYLDPFNDVDVDVIFAGTGGTKNKPTFWRGGGRGAGRGAPPARGGGGGRRGGAGGAGPGRI